MRVALIGDSIRLFSESFVRSSLPAKFEVSSPTINCKSSRDVALGIQDWIPPATVDMVHINCGLHDIRYDPGRNRPVSSPSEYTANLRSAFAYLTGIGVSVIWATSTPVNKTVPDSIEVPRWHPADVVAYNQMSVEIALSFGFQINDLHGRLSEAAVDDLLLPDGVHFNRAGNELIGKHVAAAIQAAAS